MPRRPLERPLKHERLRGTRSPRTGATIRWLPSRALGCLQSLTTSPNNCALPRYTSQALSLTPQRPHCGNNADRICKSSSLHAYNLQTRSWLALEGRGRPKPTGQTRKSPRRVQRPDSVSARSSASGRSCLELCNSSDPGLHRSASDQELHLTMQWEKPGGAVLRREHLWPRK